MVKSAAFALAVAVASAETPAYVRLGSGKMCPVGKEIQTETECKTALTSLQISTTDTWREESSTCSVRNPKSKDLAPVCKECSDDDDCGGHGTVSGSISVSLSDCTCVCSDGYNGNKCDPIPVPTCASDDHCNGHGTASGSFPDCTCACTGGYGGDTCDIVPVENESVGSAEQQQTQLQTQEQTQQQQTQGETQQQNCDPWTHCNGHGSITGNTCVCACSEGYTGKRCSTETGPSVTQHETSSDDALPGATGAAVLAVVLVYLA